MPARHCLSAVLQADLVNPSCLSQKQEPHQPAFGAWCEVAGRDLRWLSGRQDLSTYKITDRIEKYFCRNCGLHSSQRTAIGLIIDTCL